MKIQAINSLFGKLSILLMAMGICTNVMAQQFQFNDPGFEDWSGEKFSGKEQPKYWHYSNVTQFSFDFNFAKKETGRSGSCIYVQDQAMKVAGIDGGTSPGYVALGQPWAYVPSLTNIAGSTAGTYGGINWTARPDTVTLWIKRTGKNWEKENYNIVFYMWTGTAKGKSYPSDNGCTEIERTDEESDIRIALDANTCGTVQVGKEVGEALFFEKANYNNWTLLKIPVLYMNDDVPQKCNLILSAGNYPAGKSTAGFFDGNALYVDDVHLIYASTIQKLYIGGKEWKQFDPNNHDVQTYSLGTGATGIPSIVAMRGIGTETNCNGQSASFCGRKLNEKECTIEMGEVDGKETVITVRAEDGSSTSTYRIQFVSKASNNARLSEIAVNGTPISNFNTFITNYNVSLPWGTTEAPVVTATAQDAKASIEITQADNVNGTATIVSTSQDGSQVITYTLKFDVAVLSDVTLSNILVDDDPLPGFAPTKSNYTLSLPITQNEVPVVKPISAYPEGAQTITMTNSLAEGCVIQVSAPGAATSKTYKITYKQEASSYKYLKGIYVDGTLLDGFQPTRQNYTILLPKGTIQLPKITWEAGDGEQTITLFEGGIGGTTLISVTAGNGDNYNYLLNFMTEKSDDATLKMIYLDGKPLANYNPTVLQYSVVTSAESIPTITAQKNDTAQQLTIIQPATLGSARLIVTAEAGNAQTYIIRMTNGNDSITIPDAPKDIEPLSTNCDLSMIWVGGDSLKGFDPATTQYTYFITPEMTTVPEMKCKSVASVSKITTYYGSLGANSSITVTALDSTVSKTYTILFAPQTDSNTELSDISLTGYELGYTPQNHNYTVVLPNSNSNFPEVHYVKLSSYQSVTKEVKTTLNEQKITISVTSSDGNYTSKYFITIQRPANTAENVLRNIVVDGYGIIDLTTTAETTFRIPLPYGAKQMHVDSWLKNYEEQQVLVAEGGVLQPTVIKVLSGRAGEAIKTYTLIPELRTFDPAALSDIQANGVTISDFQPEQYSYVLQVTEVPTITWTADQDADVEVVEQDSKHMILTVSNGIYEHQYTIYYYYTNDIIPNDFQSAWVNTKYNSAKKPRGWTVPADVASFREQYYTGDEVSRYGIDTVKLQTIYTTTIHSTIAGMMTLGNMTMNLGTNGSTTSSVSGGITFRNTPEKILLDAKPMASDEMENWRLVATLNDATSVVYSGSYASLGSWETAELSLPYATAGVPQKLNITINSAQDENSDNLCGNMVWLVGRGKSSTLLVRNLRLEYNSLLQGVTFDQKEAARSGNHFSANTTDPEYVGHPVIGFTGEVSDQQHTILWQSGTKGKLLATIRNYAEDHSYTDYTLEYARPISTNTDTAFIRRTTRDIQVAAVSPYAEVSVDTLNGGFVVSITAENGTVQRYNYDGSSSKDITVDPSSSVKQDTVKTTIDRFQLSGISNLAAITIGDKDLEEFQPAVYSYEVYTTETTASYRKQDPAQHVYTIHPEGNQEQDQYFFYCYAPNGSMSTYSLVLKHASSSSDATLSDIRINGASLSGFSSDVTDYTLNLPAGSPIPDVVGYLNDGNASLVATTTTTIVNRATQISINMVVTAQDGVTRKTYRIVISIQPEPLTTLEMIYIGNDSISGFVPSVRTYTYLLDFGATIPRITYRLSETGQTVAQQRNGNEVTLTVTSQDGSTTGTYTIVFTWRKSANALLKMIYLDGKEIEDYNDDADQITVKLPHNATTLPQITWQVADSQQVVVLQNVAERVVNVVVTAGNGDQHIYTLNFVEAPSSNWHLSNITVKGEPLQGFHRDSLIYQITYPIGSNLDVFVTSEDIQATAEESTSTITLSYDPLSGTISILVMAEDQTTGVYIINQEILLSGNTRLKMIYLDSVALFNFNPDFTEFEYMLPKGNSRPEVTAIAEDTLSEVTMGLPGDTMLIYCDAQDGSSTTYKLYFTYSIVTPGETADYNDCQFIHIPGTATYKAVSIRNGVMCCVYNHAGQLVWSTIGMDNDAIPTCDPNYVDVELDATGNPYISKVYDGANGAITCELEIGQIYHVVFFYLKQRLKKGYSFMLSY